MQEPALCIKLAQRDGEKVIRHPEHLFRLAMLNIKINHHKVYKIFSKGWGIAQQ